MHIKILTDVSYLLLEGMERHSQFADIMDFLGLRGFKREAEYYYFKDSAEFRSIHRYSINHFNKMIIDKEMPKVNLIPTTWESATRQQVDENIRKRYIKQMFNDWKDWEVDARSKYQEWYKQLVEENHIDAACKVLDLVKCSEKCIKHLERQIIEYEAINWDMSYIMIQQNDIHEHYREKEEKIGIYIN